MLQGSRRLGRQSGHRATIPARLQSESQSHRRLWKLTKKFLTNRHYPAFAEFRAVIDECLRKMAGKYLAELKNLLTLNFQFFHLHKTSLRVV